MTNLSRSTQTKLTVRPARRGKDCPRSSRFGPGLLLAFLSLVVAGVSASAANRAINFAAPTSARAGSKVAITITASTDAGAGEKIGFFHAEYSVDGGIIWAPVSYAQNEESPAKHGITCTAGAAGSTIMVRARIAFRGGKAGDVDFTGKPIAWETSWAKWQQPPTKSARIAVMVK